MTRFLESWLGVREPNISAWRRQVCGDLTSAFDFGRRAGRQDVDAPGPVPPASRRWRPVPPVDQKMPSQEPGTRRARALPYQPDVFARTAGPEVRLSMSNQGKESVHLALFPYTGGPTAPVHFDVTSSTSHTIAVTGPEYSFTLLGPNGFRREFAGGLDGVQVESAVHGGTRVLTLALVNEGTKPETFVVSGDGRAPRYTVRPGKRRVVPWPTASRHGWYDISIAVEGRSFFRRLAGHLENGRESVSG